jgi:hypothetical protein
MRKWQNGTWPFKIWKHQELDNTRNRSTEKWTTLENRLHEEVEDSRNWTLGKSQQRQKLNNTTMHHQLYNIIMNKATTIQHQELDNTTESRGNWLTGNWTIPETGKLGTRQHHELNKWTTPEIYQEKHSTKCSKTSGTEQNKELDNTRIIPTSGIKQKEDLNNFRNRTTSGTEQQRELDNAQELSNIKK